MSGDNLLVKQTTKFYTKYITDTKIELIKKIFEASPKNNFLNLDQHHKEWGNELNKYYISETNFYSYPEER